MPELEIQIGPDSVSRENEIHDSWGQVEDGTVLPEGDTCGFDISEPGDNEPAAK